MKKYKKLVFDIEANNLLAPSLDYSCMPYKLNEDAKLWCLSIRNIEDTSESLLFIPKEYLDYKAEEYRKDWFNIDKKLVKSSFYFSDKSLSYTEEYIKLDSEVELIESNMNTIDSGVWFNNKKKYELTKENLKEAFSEAEVVVGHNIINYDLPMLQLFKVLDYSIGYPGESSTLFGKDVEYKDTLILSKILWPDRLDHYGRHSLDAWGKRTGEHKLDFHEFHRFSPAMCYYCDQDTNANVSALHLLEIERNEDDWYDNWTLPIALESKLMDLTLKQELVGFELDIALCHKNVEELTEMLEERENIINPRLPPRPLNKTESSFYIPPARQIKKDGKPSSYLINFAERLEAELIEKVSEDDPDSTYYVFKYKGTEYSLPLDSSIALEKETKATVKDNEHIKLYLLSLGWIPMEWSERDLTKDSKKKQLPPEKVYETICRYAEKTFETGFKEPRLREMNLPLKLTKDEFIENTYNQYKKNPRKPIKVVTSPKIKVGTDKEVDEGLLNIKDNKEFSIAFAEYTTYKHRKTTISGGILDEETGEPSKGYLSAVREVDQRIPTPADTIGAGSYRYTHKVVANVPRSSSIYGAPMRSLFKAGKNWVQAAFDFASLEARIEGHHVISFEGGPELVTALLAEKGATLETSYDIHSITAKKLGITRDNAKSINYGVLYGAQWPKIKKMLSISDEAAKKLYNDFWDSMPPLKQLKENLENYWEDTGKLFIKSIDNRKIKSRSQHSLLNFLFQGNGAIMSKWSVVRIAQEFEKQGLLGNPFLHSEEDVKVWQLIVYHDEVQYAIHRKLMKVKVFSALSEEESKDFNKEKEEYKKLTKEEQIKQSKPKSRQQKEEIAFLDNNTHLGQLSEVGHLDDGRSYIGLPGVFSETLLKGVDIACKEQGLKVPLGISWITGANW